MYTSWFCFKNFQISLFFAHLVLFALSQLYSTLDELATFKWYEGRLQVRKGRLQVCKGRLSFTNVFIAADRFDKVVYLIDVNFRLAVIE